MMMAQKPLMLKDFLELDWDSESSGAGFQCAPRRADDGARSMRCLLNVELRGGGGPRLPRTRSMRALKRISSVLNAVKLLPFADSPSSGGGILSRSFSRRMRASFWRKRAEPVTAEAVEEDDLGTLDDVRISCDLPSLAVSRCSSWSESEYSSRRRFISTAADAASNDAPCTAGDSCKDGRMAAGGEVSDVASGETPEREVEESPECHSSASEEEKEQLSPVSVMDFPSEEDDDDYGEDDEAGGRASTSFRHSLARLERRKLQLLRKIGRFESLTGLDPANLDRRFATCDDDDRSEEVEEDDVDERESAKSARKAWGMLQQLAAACRVDALEESAEKLLVDFFIHGLSLSCADGGGRACWRRPTAGAKEEEALLRRAKDWVEDLAGDYHGEETLREMDGEGWRRCWSEADEGEVAVDLEDLLMRSLVAEMVLDLVASR